MPGVWLDRGELDKIIDRTGAALGTTAAPAPTPAPAPREAYPPQQPRGYDDRGHHGGSHQDYRRKKRKSFLDDIFDF